MKRESSVKQVQNISQDRTRRVLDGAVKWLRRRGGRRAGRDVKAAYRKAAELVKQIKAA